MHAEMTAASERRKRAARARAARRQGVTLPRFTEGDFVLAATATGKSGNKLALVWRGPKRIVRALNDYTFEVQDLIEPYAITIRHAARLQLYRESLSTLASLPSDKNYTPLVQLHQWCVVLKTSWEPAEVIKEDVPVLFARFVNEQPDDPDRLHMTEALDALADRQPTAATALPVPKRRYRKKATPAV
ncbi:Hypothetical protein PHPALM_15896 [Phytophthora palmivora]|uniref:Uncharacterized protein n=1 Tax=Phytophthora palmivora TaxID=4796 RepID=A0A2P4XR44_9STRA|nr:Hypothetical protein PHPALM_15896 [Phytophthora palmivora]